MDQLHAHDFDVRMDYAGRQPGKINAALVELIDAGALTLEQAAPLLAPLRVLSGALAGLQAWGDELAAAAAEGVPAPTLPPGMKVADVGGLEGDGDGYTGAINPDWLGLPAWAYWSDHTELWPRAGQIFSRPYRIGDPARPGHTYTAGDLATSPRDPGPLAGV